MHALVFLTRSLIGVRLPEIFVKIMLASLYRSLLNRHYHYKKENISVRPLSLICITPLLNYHSLAKSSSVYGRYCHNYIPYFNHAGAFGKNFVKFKGEKMLFISLGQSVSGKNCTLCLKYTFSQNRHLGWRITYFCTKSRVRFVLMRLLCLQ